MQQVDRSLPNIFGGFDEPQLDFEGLRSARLRKVQGEMNRVGVSALVLTNVVNIRYVTGLSVMPLWTAVNYARYVVVPVEGDPTIFEYPEAAFRAAEFYDDVRPTRYWQFRFAGSSASIEAKKWAAEIVQVLKDRNLAAGKIGVDSLDFYGFQALQSEGVELADADEPLEAARMTKLPAELALMRQSAAVCEAALAELDQAIKPGVTENELLGVFWHKMLSMGGEWCFTRLINSGARTNPWFQEAGNKMVRPGDLVAIDTDMIGPHGYACDISRTFLCGEDATLEQKEAYKVATDFVQGTIELCKVGASHQEIAEKLPPVPREYKEQRYPIFLHGIGTDDEPPFWDFLDKPGVSAKNEHLKEGMVIAVEFYAGKVGAQHGVKFEDQIVIKDSGPELMTLYPMEKKLL